MRATFAPLRGRSFRFLLAARTISTLGSGFAPVALAFAVIDLHGGPSSLGLVLAALILPLIVFTLAGGVWADRLPRQRVMIASDLVSGATQCTIGLLLIAGSARLWHLIVLVALRGAAAAFFNPAAAGVVPQIVGPDELQPANALLRLSSNISGVGGAAAAGLLVAAAGPGWALTIDGVSYGVGAALVAAAALEGVVRVPERRFLRELAEGWREFRARRWLWAMVVQFALVNSFATAAFFVLGPFVAARSLGGPAVWGLILAAQVAGMVVAALTMLRIRPGRPLLVASFGLLAPALPVAGLAAGAPTAAIVGASVVAGCGVEVAGVLWATTLQEQIPEETLSRVSSYDLLFSFGLIPLGLLIVGPASELVGIRATLAVAAAVVVVAALAVVSVGDVRGLRAGRPEAHVLAG